MARPFLQKTNDLPGDVVSKNVSIEWHDSESKSRRARGHENLVITAAMVAFENNSALVRIREGIHQGTYTKVKDTKSGQTIKTADLYAPGKDNHYTAELLTKKREWRNFHFFMEESLNGVWVPNKAIKPNPEMFEPRPQPAPGVKTPLREKVVLCKKDGVWYVRYTAPPAKETAKSLSTTW